MNTDCKQKTSKQIKREDRNEITARRRAMHKFQDRWKIMNIKYADRKIVGWNSINRFDEN